MDAVLQKPFTIRALADCLAGNASPAIAESSAIRQSEESPEGAATRGPPADGDSILDPEILAQLEDMAAEGRHDFVNRMFSLYLEHAPLAASRIVQTISLRDAKGAADAAHSLKSMSYSIGAIRVSKAAAEIEAFSRTGALALNKVDLGAFAAALNRTCRFIATRMTDHATPIELQAERDAAGHGVAAQTISNELLPAPDDALLRDLRAALSGEGLWIAYQPIVDKSGEITLGVEALVRWNRPGYGELPPAKFIPLAEKSGDIIALGEWVMRRACHDAIDWPRLRIAINVSSLQFQQPNFADAVETILADTGLDPYRLEIELTETTLLSASKHTNQVMDRLGQKGITFSLDDFGTGYSSLMYLRQFPFTKIKIDRGFIADVLNDIGSATIVHAIVSIGRALGMQIVAEGVETPEQHRFLATAGVHLLQGYLFGKPVAANEIRLRSERIAAATYSQ
jgi:EAL domain-containing protein (putative c-di-GMP-specific phosphodiesterase class I)/HPt (histidine-containing phosphotransfer) domain-containing protein